MWKKKIFWVIFGLLLVCGMSMPANAETVTHTETQIGFYSGSGKKDVIDRQINHKIPNGETAYQMPAKKLSKGVGQLTGWLSTNGTAGNLPQTSELVSIYWTLLGSLLIVALGLFWLVISFSREGDRHVEA